MKRKKLSYPEKAEQIAKLIDLAKEIIDQTNKLSNEEKEYVINFGAVARDKALNPEPPFKRISSLKLLENDLLNYWEHVLREEMDLLWTKIYDNNLKIRNRNNIRLVLKRNKITNRQEYNFVIDRIAEAKQLGEINDLEVKILNKLLSDFEINEKANHE